MDEDLLIKNSIINEIGIAGPSQIVVDSSLLQLAMLAAVGSGGNTLIINNSEIWNQSITAANNSTVILNNCNVTGSVFSTSDSLSSITVNGGCFFETPSGCTQAAMVDITTEQPYCNPFIPAGFPQNLSPLNVSFNDVNSNCVIEINEVSIENTFAIFPNPATNKLSISFTENINHHQPIQIFNAMGVLMKEKLIIHSTEINIADLPDGLYFINFENNKHKAQKFIKK